MSDRIARLDAGPFEASGSTPGHADRQTTALHEPLAALEHRARISHSGRVGRATMDPTGQLPAFAYVTAPQAGAYRRIMRAFTAARARFELHLRPSDIREQLARSEPPLILDEIAVAPLLQQLCAWGNLEAHPDTADVATVEDFFRARLLYQLTPHGEAAEAAITQFEETIERPGELQTAALADIVVHLRELERLCLETKPDESKVHRALIALSSRFDELTSQAQRFMASLQRAIDLRGRGVEEVLGYKQLLIHYLERFIHHLVAASVEITECLERLDAGIDPLLDIAAERDLVDAVGRDDARRERARADWKGRWSGLRAWWIGRHHQRAQSEVLRGRARSACTALLAAIDGIHERRTQRSDRTADFRVLARWFAECASEDEAHQLCRAAFGLHPSRHLFVDDATLAVREASSETFATSWFDAAPVEVSLRFRTTGAHTRRGRPSSVVDRTVSKRELEALMERETTALSEARKRLATGERIRLSQLAELDAPAFDLFLELLGEALSAKVRPADSVETASPDGALTIRLEPTLDGALASIRTTTGTLIGPDHYVTISDAHASSEAEAAE